MWRKTDYTGRKFGRWTVIGVAPNHITNGGYSVPMWDCVCDCGTRRAVRGNDLRLRKSVSCGCYMVENPVSKKHGASNSHLYKIYYGMKQRCYNKSNKNYNHYGERGIDICKEWESYEAFEKWAYSNGYQDGLTIERKNVNQGYSPNNCEWIGRAEQAKNKTTSVLITHNGETHIAAEWDKLLGFSHGTVGRRIRNGWSVEDAITVIPGEREKMMAIETAKAALPKVQAMTTEPPDGVE